MSQRTVAWRALGLIVSSMLTLALSTWVLMASADAQVKAPSMSKAITVSTQGTPTADEIATLWRNENRWQEYQKKGFFFWPSQKKIAEWPDSASILDPELIEIIEKGDIHLFPLTDPVEKFEKLLKQLFFRSDVLDRAWKLFALYDENAKRQQKVFVTLNQRILTIGVIATALVVFQTLLRSLKILLTGTLPDQLFNALVLLTPIVVSVLLAGLKRFKPDDQWILLRASAEAIKREIYRYRSRTGKYTNSVKRTSSHPNISPEEELTEKVNIIYRQLMRTVVNTSGLQPYTGPIPPLMYGAAGQDDGYSKLTPERYIAIRIDDQLAYFQGRTNQLGKTSKRSYWLIFIVGGIGTFFVAIGLQIMVALTTAIASAFTAHLETRQVEETIVRYNRKISELETIKYLWITKPKEQQQNPANFDELVNLTEQILEDESERWVNRQHDVHAALEGAEKKARESRTR